MSTPAGDWPPEIRRRESLKYSLAHFAQLILWFGLPLILAAYFLVSRDDRIYPLLAFAAVNFLVVPFMFMRCGFCKTELYFDQRSKALMGPRINVFKEIKATCPGCGIPRG